MKNGIKFENYKHILLLKSFIIFLNSFQLILVIIILTQELIIVEIQTLVYKDDTHLVKHLHFEIYQSNISNLIITI